MRALWVLGAVGSTLLSAALIASCSSDESSTNTGGSDASADAAQTDSGGNPPDAQVGPAPLTAADKPDVTPCPSQDIVKDAAQFAPFHEALKNGAITYLDVPFDGADPDIYKKKCGADGFWNPADNTNELPLGAPPPTFADIVIDGNSGICADGFAQLGQDEGFPAAGTYRKELKVAHQGATYHARIRLSSSGPASGKKFADEGVSGKSDIETALKYEINGQAVVHDDVWKTGIDALKADGTAYPGFEFKANKPDGSPLITSTVEFICVSKS